MNLVTDPPHEIEKQTKRRGTSSLRLIDLVVGQVRQIEQTIGIHDLNQFTLHRGYKCCSIKRHGGIDAVPKR